MAALTESVVEEAVLNWFLEIGYVAQNGAGLAPNDPSGHTLTARHDGLLPKLWDGARKTAKWLD